MAGDGAGRRAGRAETVVLVVAIIGIWALAMALMSLDLPLKGTVLGICGAIGVGLVAMAAAVLVARRSGRRGVVLLAAIATPVVLAMVVNWGAFAPRLWFESHRPFYALAAQSAVRSEEYYGAPLPLHWRFLSATGSVSTVDGAQFFPLWLGIPDDAGGYFYSPDASPEGLDMYGMICVEPVDLGGGWWLCGFKDGVW